MPAPGYPCVVRTLAFDMDRTAAEYGRLHMCLEQTIAMRPQMSRARTLLARLKQDNLDFHYAPAGDDRSEEHTSELQSLMRTSYAVFCLKQKKTQTQTRNTHKTKYQ